MDTHTHFCSALVERRILTGEGGGSRFDLLVGFIFYLFGASILRKLLLGFSLQGFPRINLCCYCDTVSFSDPVYMLLL